VILVKALLLFVKSATEDRRGLRKSHPS
jgi:hypothetical protein